jgi:hypothetical protein
MVRYLPRHLLLIVALLLSQWLVVAHAHEHPATAADQVCELCVHAQQLGSAGIAAAPAQPAFEGRTEAPASAGADLVAGTAPVVLRNRGPPVH